MIEIIGQAIAGHLADVPFADKVAGLVKELTVENETGGAPLKYPVHYERTESECIRLGYHDLVPDSRKKSIMYVENYGTRVLERHRDDIKLKTTLRVVGWGGKEVTALAAGYVLQAIPERINVPSLLWVNLTPIAILGVDEKVFSRYTYKEEELQYLLYPYTAFAIVYEATYTIRLDCLPEITL